MNLRSLMMTMVCIALLAPSHGLAAVDGVVRLAGSEAPVFVYIKHVDQPAPYEKSRATILQRNVRFVPSYLVVRVGQEIDFPNADKFYHNVFSFSEGNEFDLGLYRSGGTAVHAMKSPGEVTIYCNIHPQMVSRILVVQNEFYGQVAKGRYSIEGVPDGKYTLVAWSPLHVSKEVAIEVKGGVAASNFDLVARKKVEKHLNKFGEKYGRYK